jgi:hypothetical protein
MANSDPFLFVSHVAEDRAAALEIVDELERRGVPCWIAPRNVSPGSKFDDEISDALESCRAMLLIFSQQCNDSEYIHREVTVAGESRKVIIPFRIEDVQPQRGLRVRLADLHWIDGFVSRELGIDQLARTFARRCQRTGNSRKRRQNHISRPMLSRKRLVASLPSRLHRLKQKFTPTLWRRSYMRHHRQGRDVVSRAG